MESIEQIKTEFKPSEGQIKYTGNESKGAYILIPHPEPVEPKTEFLQYTNSHTYKARVITRTFNKVFYKAKNEKQEKVQGYLRNNIKVLELVSYNTSIAIYDTWTQTLLLRREYYNCSRTTARQLDYFLINKPISNTYYLTDANYKYIKEDLNPNRIYNIVKKQIQPAAQRQEIVFNILNHPTLTQHEKAAALIRNMKGLNTIHKNHQSQEVQELKTRERITDTYILYGVRFFINYSRTKRTHRQLTQYKITLDNTGEYWTHDTRTHDDKNLYNGWDFLNTANKQDFQQVY